MATPSMTRAMPPMSTGVGSWRRTTTPVTTAVAGSSATNNAYVGRGRRAIASWSHTYGTTDDVTPTPAPASSATGSFSATRALGRPIGETHTSATVIAAARPETPFR